MQYAVLRHRMVHNANLFAVLRQGMVLKTYAVCGSKLAKPVPCAVLSSGILVPGSRVERDAFALSYPQVPYPP